ncbi:YxeA family protein [Acinetobacter baumannii]|nr:YxeA family protein [Acinetobacter baumannii]
MKKFILGTVMLGLLIVGTPIIGSTMIRGIKPTSDNNLAQIFDRFNILIKEEPTYVVTDSSKAKKQEPGGYIYYQRVISKNGKEYDLSYYAGRKLKEGAILKLKAKGRYVDTWEEVEKEKIPKEVLEKIDI